MPRFASRWTRPILLALCVAAGLVSVAFGLRSYHSFLLLRSAYELGAPKIGAIRPIWSSGKSQEKSRPEVIDDTAISCCRRQWVVGARSWITTTTANWK